MEIISLNLRSQSNIVALHIIVCLSHNITTLAVLAPHRISWPSRLRDPVVTCRAVGRSGGSRFQGSCACRHVPRMLPAYQRHKLRAVQSAGRPPLGVAWGCCSSVSARFAPTGGRADSNTETARRAGATPCPRAGHAARRRWLARAACMYVPPFTYALQGSGAIS